MLNVITMKQAGALLGAAVLIATAFGVEGQAQPRGPYPNGAYPYYSESLSELRAQDWDGDGYINENEAAYAASLRFEQMDANDDEVVSREEYLQADRALTMAFQYGELRQYEEMRARVEERFDKYDGPDQDGRITRAEFLDQVEEDFAQADENDDGRVDPWG